MSAELSKDLTNPGNWIFSDILSFRQVLEEEGEPNLLGIPYFSAGRYNAGRNMGELGWGETNLIQIKDPTHQWYDPDGHTFHLLSRAVSGRSNFACLAKAVESADHKSIHVGLQEAPSGEKVVFIPLPGGQVSLTSRMMK